MRGLAPDTQAPLMTSVSGPWSVERMTAWSLRLSRDISGAVPPPNLSRGDSERKLPMLSGISLCRCLFFINTPYQRLRHSSVIQDFSSLSRLSRSLKPNVSRLGVS